MGQKFKIKIKFFATFWQGILGSLDGFFRFFSLRRSRQFWGVVYDSVSKQPLDPAIVKLLYADSREVETCVTDLAGRYGFLARPGKFKIFARKSNYIFPSEHVAGGSDGIYENLYHGEFFILGEGDEVVAPNIPMDPVGQDWNQIAKLKITDTHPFWKLLFKKIWAVAFWFAFLYCAVLLWQGRARPVTWVVGLFLFFPTVLLLAWLLPEPRLWGRLFAPSSPGISYFLELHNPLFPDVVQGRARAVPGGRFLLRARPGAYLLTLKVDGPDGQAVLAEVPIKIGINGVFNSSLIARVLSK